MDITGEARKGFLRVGARDAGDGLLYAFIELATRHVADIRPVWPPRLWGGLSHAVQLPWTDRSFGLSRIRGLVGTTVGRDLTPFGTLDRLGGISTVEPSKWISEASAWS